MMYVQEENHDNNISLNGADGRRRSVQSISQLGNALSKEHVDPSTKLRVVWPKEKCKMLGEEVVIIDSPGKFKIFCRSVIENKVQEE